METLAGLKELQRLSDLISALSKKIDTMNETMENLDADMDLDETNVLLTDVKTGILALRSSESIDSIVASIDNQDLSDLPSILTGIEALRSSSTLDSLETKLDAMIVDLAAMEVLQTSLETALSTLNGKIDDVLEALKWDDSAITVTSGTTSATTLNTTDEITGPVEILSFWGDRGANENENFGGYVKTTGGTSVGKFLFEDSGNNYMMMSHWNFPIYVPAGYKIAFQMWGGSSKAMVWVIVSRAL